MVADADSNVAVQRLDFTFLQMAAVVCIVTAAFSSQMAMPLWIGAIIDTYGLSRSVAGAIGGAEMAVVAIVSVAMAVRIHRYSARPAVMIGLACLISGNLGAAFVQDAPALAVARILAGCGKGIIVTISYSLAARASHPMRAFAAITAAYAIFATALFLVMPSVIEAAHAPGCFTLLAALSLVSAIFMPWFPASRMQNTGIHRVNLNGVQRYGLTAMAALIITGIGHTAIWTFVERIGLRLALTPAEVGQVLSIAAFTSIGGPWLARLTDTRFGYTPPLVTAVSAMIVIGLLLVHSAAQSTYVLLVPAFMLLVGFVSPYFLTILSIADPAGRLAAAATAAMTMGGSLGAIVGGWAADRLDYRGLGWVAASHFFVAIVLLLITSRLESRSIAVTQALAENRS